MANVVTKLDGEVRRGAILGVLQTDGDKFRMGLSRKLKKSLKKKHGVYRLQYHPNTETVVTINSQN